MTRSTSNRNSSIELLKIIGIIIIVASHVVQTVGTKGNPYINFDDYYHDITAASLNIQHIIISILGYGGTFGNTVFFACSAWFLTEKANNRKNKVLQLAGDSWVISVLILLLIISLWGGYINNGSLIIRSFLPISSQNCWYVNCYMLFYLVYPFLNRIISSANEKQLFRIVFLLSCIYLGLGYINSLLLFFFTATTWFSSSIIIWVTLYFLIAYIKEYSSDSKRLDTQFITIGAVGLLGNILLMNFLGLKIPILENSLLMWNSDGNPFVVVLVIGLIRKATRIKFHSRIINYISGMSLYIYLIHDNLLMRSIIRPLLWRYIHAKYGYNLILLWVIILTVTIFLVSLIAGTIYHFSLHKVAVRVADFFYPRIVQVYKRIEARFV